MSTTSPSSLSKEWASIDYQLRHLGDNRDVLSYVIGVLFFVLAAIAVALRFASRKVAKLPCQADDYVTLLGLVSMPPMANVQGLGRPAHRPTTRYSVLASPPIVSQVSRPFYPSSPTRRPFKAFELISLDLVVQYGFGRHLMSLSAAQIVKVSRVSS